MSTGVDQRREMRPRLSAAQSRERVLRAARSAFSHAGYDVVGIREIAKAARTDPAIVMRLFGSKSALFKAVADAVFEDEPVFRGPVSSLADRIAQHLASPMLPPQHDAEPEFDDFQFLLRSATSADAAPILSEALHRRLIAPLAAKLGKRDAQLRATLLVSYILGFSTMRFALRSEVIESTEAAKLVERLAETLATCIE